MDDAPSRNEISLLLSSSVLLPAKSSKKAMRSSEDVFNYSIFFFLLLFWRKKVAQKIGRKLTRTVGLWVLRSLGKDSRTIPAYDFGCGRPAERCSNIDFRRWMCG
jgi:hypothetical protein